MNWRTSINMVSSASTGAGETSMTTTTSPEIPSSVPRPRVDTTEVGSLTGQPLITSTQPLTGGLSVPFISVLKPFSRTGIYVCFYEHLRKQPCTTIKSSSKPHRPLLQHCSHGHAIVFLFSGSNKSEQQHQTHQQQQICHGSIRSSFNSPDTGSNFLGDYSGQINPSTANCRRPTSAKPVNSDHEQPVINHGSSC